MKECAPQVTIVMVERAFDLFVKAVPAPAGRTWILERSYGKRFGLFHKASIGGGGLSAGPLGDLGMLGAAREARTLLMSAMRLAEHLHRTGETDARNLMNGSHA